MSGMYQEPVFRWFIQEMNSIKHLMIKKEIKSFIPYLPPGKQCYFKYLNL